MSKKLVENIRALAAAKGMTLKDVGKESGVGENSIYRWEKTEPKLSTLRKVAEVLGVDYKILLP